MNTIPSLNTLNPDTTTHGVEITLQVQLASGAYSTMAEIFEIDWDEDQMPEDLPVLGSRRTGQRSGRFNVSGTLHAYYVNSYVRGIVQNAATPLSTGAASAIYHSQSAYRRYLIQVVSSNPNTPSCILYNVTFGKDTNFFKADGVSKEAITFSAEDTFEQ